MMNRRTCLPAMRVNYPGLVEKQRGTSNNSEKKITKAEMVRRVGRKTNIK